MDFEAAWALLKSVIVYYLSLATRSKIFINTTINYSLYWSGWEVFSKVLVEVTFHVTPIKDFLNVLLLFFVRMDIF